MELNWARGLGLLPLYKGSGTKTEPKHLHPYLIPFPRNPLIFRIRHLFHSSLYSGSNETRLWPRLGLWPFSNILPASYPKKLLLPVALALIDPELSNAYSWKPSAVYSLGALSTLDADSTGLSLWLTLLLSAASPEEGKKESAIQSFCCPTLFYKPLPPNNRSCWFLSLFLNTYQTKKQAN